MDIATTESVKEDLLESSETFRDLVNQHKKFESRLVELSSLTYPNEDEQLEEATIKRKKLTVKDEIYAMMNEYNDSH